MLLIIVLLLLFPVIYFIVERQKTKNTNDSRQSDVKKKEMLDAILKNNKDRYQPD
jgi:preprotein translocase subunit YajC